METRHVVTTVMLVVLSCAPLVACAGSSRGSEPGSDAGALDGAGASEGSASDPDPGGELAKKDDAQSHDTSATSSRLSVFVTSDYSGGNFQGKLSNADAFCNKLATKAGLSGHFVAWLSNSTTDAADRVTGAGPWYTLPSGSNAAALVAANHDALVSGTLAHAINVTETGIVYKDSAWTGTDEHGKVTSRTCNDWTSVDDNVVGDSGWSENVDRHWTSNQWGGCASLASLYCFEVR